MKKTFNFFAVLIFVVSLYSCSGGGGGGPAPTPIALKTSTIRTMQPGDIWNFSGTGTFTSGTSVNVSASGSETILSSLITDPTTSTNCLDDFITLTLSGPSGALATLSAHTYFAQDLAGTMYEYGENDGSGDVWVSAASGGFFVSSQSPLATNQIYGSSVTYTDGSTSTTTEQVIGTENVSTPAGYYEAYKILEKGTYTYSDGTSAIESNTVWYVPGLGMVKETFNVVYYTGNTSTGNLTLTISLTSTSVTY